MGNDTQHNTNDTTNTQCYITSLLLRHPDKMIGVGIVAVYLIGLIAAAILSPDDILGIVSMAPLALTGSFFCYCSKNIFPDSSDDDDDNDIENNYAL